MRVREGGCALCLHPQHHGGRCREEIGGGGDNDRAAQCACGIQDVGALYRWDMLLIAPGNSPALGGFNSRAHVECLTYNPPPEFGDELRTRWRSGLETGDAVFRVTKVQPTMLMNYMVTGNVPQCSWIIEVIATLISFTTNAREVSKR